MVQIIVFVPSPDNLQWAESMARELESSETKIDVVHHFGTPEILKRLDQYDVIVARGITYRKLCDLYPDKHITHLNFDGADILEALLRCRAQFHPSKIGLCLNREGLQDVLPGLERACDASIRLYDVVDEASAFAAVEAALADGMEALVSAGTVSNICQERGVPCTYISTRTETLRRVTLEAVKAARSINTERTKSNIIRMILEGSEDAVMAVDESGCILEANGRARQLYQLDAKPDWRKCRVNAIHPELTYIGNDAAPCKDGDERLLMLGGQRYLVRYRLIAGESAATGTLITTSAATKILQEERQIRWNLVRRGLTAKYQFRNIIAVSDIMRSKIEIAKKFSLANSNVLITGETGTGKELFAHSIHSASNRSGQPFVAVNCATLPESLLESELFGYEPGAFSGASKEGRTGLFEQAHHGTIFLDEIGEIPVSLQAKLLRVLQEKEIRRVGSTTVIPVDVRVIAATNIDIQQRMAQGTFRSDLLYRLNTLEIQIPPLRERRADILPLVEWYLGSLASEMGKRAPVLTPEAKELLERYYWPGNVRELRNVCERLVVLGNDRPVDGEALQQLHMFVKQAASGQSGSPEEAGTVVLPVYKKKKDLAKELGISRTTLWRMTKRQEEARRRREEEAAHDQTP